MKAVSFLEYVCRWVGRSWTDLARRGTTTGDRSPWGHSILFARGFLLAALYTWLGRTRPSFWQASPSFKLASKSTSKKGKERKGKRHTNNIFNGRARVQSSHQYSQILLLIVLTALPSPMKGVFGRSRWARAPLDDLRLTPAYLLTKQTESTSWKARERRVHHIKFINIITATSPYYKTSRRLLP